MIKLDAAQMAINVLANRCEALVGEGTIAKRFVRE